MPAASPGARKNDIESMAPRPVAAGNDFPAILDFPFKAAAFANSNKNFRGSPRSTPFAGFPSQVWDHSGV